jgi:glycosyltransferase involved in cell wall biosynthesis
MPSTVSVAMIVKNEEVMLHACLESVKGADEIVIVDTGSTDRTIDIAKQYGKVYHQIWEDDFSKARNYSISKCTGDWILVIDADEVLNSSMTEVRKAIKKAGDKVFMTVNVGIFETIDGVMKNKTYDQKSVRMFRRIPDICYHRPIHNTLTYKGSQVEPRKMAYDSGLSMSSGYSPAHNNDPDRTFRMLKKELEADPKSTRAMYYLAVEYLYKIQDQDNALDLLLRYFKTAYIDRWAEKEPYELFTNELADACYLMATIYINKGDWHRAMSCAITAANCWYSFKAPYVMISKLYEIAGMIEPAKFYAEVAKKADNKGVLFAR